MPDVRLVKVTKRFGRIVAVDNVNLHIHDGEYVTLLGPSGCGKTTTLRIIAGLTRPDEGEVYIGDRRVDDLPPEERGIGFVFQLFAIFPHMTVRDNVMYGPAIKGWSPKEVEGTATSALAKTGLSGRAEAYPQELSLGELQKVGLARVLATGAELLLLDEPLGALDLKVRQELRWELRRLVKDLRLTAIHVTHDQEEAMTISDRIVLMRAGRIVQVGSSEVLYNRPESPFVASFIGEASFLEGTVIRKDEGSLVELRGGLRVGISGRGFEEGSKVVVAIRPERLRIEEGVIEGINCLSGRVEAVRLAGWLSQYDVRLDNGDTVTVEKAFSNTRPIDVGELVTVSFKPEEALAFQYPREGLKEALALE